MRGGIQPMHRDLAKQLMLSLVVDVPADEVEDPFCFVVGYSAGEIARRLRDDPLTPEERLTLETLSAKIERAWEAFRE